MKSFNLIFALTLAVTLLQAADNKYGSSPYNSSKRDEEVLLKLQNQWTQAAINRDVAALSKIQADDFTLVTPDGVVLTKAQDLANYRDGTLQFESMSHSDVNVRVYIGGAVITGQTALKGKFKDTDISGNYRFIDVYESRKGSWVAVSSQITKVASKP